MIVRISEEAQFELPDDLHAAFNDLDDAVVAAVDRGDEPGFHTAYAALLQFVRDRGTEVGDDDLRPSEIIIPPADLSFQEAGEEFTGEGLVPDPEPAA